MKKVFSAILIILLLFCVGCATAQEETVPEWGTEEDGTIDMAGLTFRFGTAWINEYYPALGFSSAGDKMLARYSDTAEHFNITVEVTKTEDSSSIVARDIAAGLSTFDLLDVHSTNAMPLYKAGYMYPMNEISTIDLTEDYKYAPESFRRYGIYKGNAYGFYPWAWEFIPQFEGTILFNNELVLKYGLENPYEMQESGNWTWENFRKCLETIQSVAAADEIIPMVHNDLTRMGKTAILSNGGAIVEEKDGTYTNGLTSEKAYKALDYLRDLLSAKLMESGGIDQFAVKANAVFMSTESYHGTLHTETDVNEPSVRLNDYGMMPFPYGPDADASTVSAYIFHGRRLLWVVGYSGNDPEEIGTIVDYMFEPLDGDSEDVPAWKVYCESMTFHHHEGYENFVNMIDNIKYDYSVELNDISSEISNAMSRAIGGHTTASEAMETINRAVQACIDENLNNKD